MDAKIQEITKKVGGTWGIYAKYLEDDQEIFSFNADEVFYAASVNKVAIAAFVLRQVQSGQADLKDQLTLTDEYRLPGTGVLQRLDEGLEITLKDALTLMLMVSDNVAAIMLVKRFGAPKINEFLRSLGLEQTQLEELEDNKFTFGDSTPREMATLLSGIYHDRFLDHQLSQLMMTVMLDCHFSAGIRRYLPKYYQEQTKLLVANKEGTFEDSRHDVALIHGQKPYVLAIFSKDLEDQSYGVENTGAKAIAEISKVIYEASQ